MFAKTAENTTRDKFIHDRLIRTPSKPSSVAIHVLRIAPFSFFAGLSSSLNHLKSEVFQKMMSRSLLAVSRLRPTFSVCAVRRNLFTGAGRENSLQFDYKKMSDEQLYANLNKLRAALPADEFSVVEERVMAPYRKKNRQLGFGLGFFVVMVCE
ncbi:hypothetical protein BC830DRAFT_1167164 [Chytriomyces sp. MP71]|nr:hypothetical protein BC830DRAFT_1167164 [Chytriomyces sp. MP71]